MNRRIKTILHAATGSIALLIITLFFIATVTTELLSDTTAIVMAKRSIVYGLFVLVPSTAAAGISGAQLAGRSRAPIIQRKKRRMVMIAINGIAVLMPCAIALYWLASSNAFGPLFQIIQAVELIAGPINIALLLLNMRDGLILSRRISAPHRGTKQAS
jgi:hypothetical protein